MKRLFVIAALFCLVVPTALAVPPAGKGNHGKPQSSQSSQSTQSADKGNHGKPQSSQSSQSTQSADKNAAKTCKAERARIGVEAFKTRHGTNANKANAFGKCVSSLAKEHGSSS